MKVVRRRAETVSMNARNGLDQLACAAWTESPSSTAMPVSKALDTVTVNGESC